MQLLSTVAQFKNPTIPALTLRKFLELASTILPAVGRPFVSEQLGLNRTGFAGGSNS